MILNIPVWMVDSFWGFKDSLEYLKKKKKNYATFQCFDSLGDSSVDLAGTKRKRELV